MIFFFQAEDGIRDKLVTGVQTCALPISELMGIARGMYERMGFVQVPEYDFQAGPEVLVLGYRLDL